MSTVCESSWFVCVGSHSFRPLLSRAWSLRATGRGHCFDENIVYAINRLLKNLSMSGCSQRSSFGYCYWLWLNTAWLYRHQCVSESVKGWMQGAKNSTLRDYKMTRKASIHHLLQHPSFRLCPVWYYCDLVFMWFFFPENLQLILLS